MRVRLTAKTIVRGSRAEPTGSVHDVPEPQAKFLIDHGRAVAVTADEGDAERKREPGQNRARRPQHNRAQGDGEGDGQGD